MVNAQYAQDAQPAGTPPAPDDVERAGLNAVGGDGSTPPSQSDQTDPNAPKTDAPIDPSMGDEKELITRLLAVLVKYRDCKERVTIEQIWRAVFLAYRGYKPPRADPTRLIYVIREVFRQMETLRPQVFKQFFSGEQLFRYKPRHSGFEDRAQAAERIVHYQAQKYGIIAELKKWLSTWKLYGTAYVYPTFRKFRHTRMKPFEMTGKEIDPVTGVAPTFYTRKSEEIPQETPWLEHIAPWDIYSHPRAEDPRDSSFVFWHQTVSGADLKTMVAEGYIDGNALAAAAEQDKGGNAGGFVPFMEANRPNPASYDPSIDTIPTEQGQDNPQDLLICWSNNGWETVILNHKTVLRHHRLTASNGRIPLLCLRNYPQLQEHWGIPEPHLILEDQRQLNDLSSIAMEALHYEIPIWMVDRSAVADFRATNFRPGNVIPVETMNPLPIQPLLQTQRGSMDLFQHAQWILQRMTLTTGITPEMAGTGSNAKTATMGTRLQEAAGDRMQNTVQDIIPMVREAYQALYDLNAENLSEPVKFMLEGQDGKDIPFVGTPAAFEPDIDVEVELADQMESLPEMASKWGQAMPILANNPMVDQLAVVKKYIRALGVRKVNDLLVNPATQQSDALDENYDWVGTGVMADVHPNDNHAIHIQTHSYLVNNPALMAQKTPQQQKDIQDHLQIHTEYAQMQMQQQAAAAQAPQGPPPGSNQTHQQAVTNRNTEARFRNGARGAAQQGAPAPAPGGGR